MSIFTNINSFFNGQEVEKSSKSGNETPVSLEIIEFVASLASKPEAVEFRKQKLLEAQSLPLYARTKIKIEVYRQIVSFLEDQDPVRKITEEEIKEQVRKKFEITGLQDGFPLIFLEEREQVLSLAISYLNTIAESSSHFINITEFIKELPASQAVLKYEFGRFVVHELSSEKEEMAAKELRTIFATLYAKLKSINGEKPAQDLFETIYKSLKDAYSQSIASVHIIINLLPQNLLLDERISFLSRQSLEEKVKQQNEQLQRELELAFKKNLELENNKKAMINLLEDARELEKNLETEKASIEAKIKERTQELEMERHKLDEEQKRLFKFLNSIPEGVFVLDAHGKPFFANDEARRLLGKGIIETDPNGLAQVYQAYIEGTQKPYPAEKMPVVLALSGKTTMVRDMELQNGDRRTPLEVIGRPIKDSEGNISFAIATFKDITEERILARSKDEFFSIASHELRTPLTAIRGNTALIQQYFSEIINQNPELVEMINDIHESSVRLIEIVNDFLNTSRLELGKMEFKKEDVDLIALIQSVIKEYVTTGSIKKLYLKAEVPPEPLPHVVGDSDRLKQILINLVGNAIKFTEQGGITIKPVLEGGKVSVYVSDTGKGISPQSQALLFRKFQQATESLFTRDATQGTGLGLYISKMMMDGMNGEIKLVSSELGKGTVFSISLPVISATNKPVSTPVATNGIPVIIPPLSTKPPVKSETQASPEQSANATPQESVAASSTATAS